MSKKKRRTTAVVRVRGNPVTDPTVANEVHSRIIASTVYAKALAAQVADSVDGVELAESANTYVTGVIERVDPKDPLEEMLAVQALMAHTRVLHLSNLANSQTDLNSLRIVNEYADKASNTFRRLMLALGEYRRPTRGGTSTTTIGQANIGGQQMVVNAGPLGNTNEANEQGFQEEDEGISIVEERIESSSCGGSTRAAVGVVNGTANRRGESGEL